MMEEKWRIVFKLVDINKDGVVSSADRDSCKTNFSALCTSNTDQLCADLDQFWNNVVFPDGSPDWSVHISEDQFAERFWKSFSGDKDTTVSRVSEALKCLLKAADLNKDGIFTFDKFLKFHQAFNLGHEVVVRTTFNLIGPSPDDTCTFDQVHGFYVELFVGEDKDKFESLKNAYRAIGML
ncbi:hypothetical protein ACF0H5_001818 [Mactra antiquata]